MAKYEPRRPSGDRPICVLGISDVVVIEQEPAVPVTLHRVSAWGRWSRDVWIPDAAPARIRELAESFDIVWASEWGHNAHTAFREALELPEEPWPFLPVQFDKLQAVRAYAADVPWVWLDSAVTDLHTRAADDGDGIVVRLDPAVGIAGVDVAELVARLSAPVCGAG